MRKGLEIWLCPLLSIFFIFELKMVGFGAFYVLFFYSSAACFTQND